MAGGILPIAPSLSSHHNVVGPWKTLPLTRTSHLNADSQTHSGNGSGDRTWLWLPWFRPNQTSVACAGSVHGTDAAVTEQVPPDHPPGTPVHLVTGWRWDFFLFLTKYSCLPCMYITETALPQRIFWQSERVNLISPSSDKVSKLFWCKRGDAVQLCDA